MVLRILEEPVDETSQPVEVSIAARLAGCAVACLIALIPQSQHLMAHTN